MKVMKQLLRVPCLEFLLEVILQGKALTIAGHMWYRGYRVYAARWYYASHHYMKLQGN